MRFSHILNRCKFTKLCGDFAHWVHIHFFSLFPFFEDLSSEQIIINWNLNSGFASCKCILRRNITEKTQCFILLVFFVLLNRTQLFKTEISRISKEHEIMLSKWELEYLVILASVMIFRRWEFYCLCIFFLGCTSALFA